MSLKREFVMLADDPDANMSALCRRFEISRPTGYKWLHRYQEDGLDGLEERSRRPDTSPNQTPEPIADAVCAVRRAHPAWGGRKIRAVLKRRARDGPEADLPGSDPPGSDPALPDARSFDAEAVPAASTCQAIVKRRGLVSEEASRSAQAFQRFERAAPNELWQMDFKGHFPLVNGERCHTLTVIDDHSRFALAVQACPNEQRETVQAHLTTAFERYGRPRQILCDNSLPWGVPTAEPDGRPLYTQLNAWLFRLGIDVIHGAPYHPQTQGKDERFHRSLQEEVITPCAGFQSLRECQQAFDHWRSVYNQQRPHEALAQQVPTDHYQISGRPFPDELPPVTYPASEHVRAVSAGGQIGFQGERWYVGEAFDGASVALRRSDPERSGSTWTVYYCQTPIRTIDVSSS